MPGILSIYRVRRPEEEESPGEGCHMSENFRIHQISHPDQKTGESNNDNYVVNDPKEWLFLHGRKDDQGNDDTDSGSVTGKASFPNRENLHWVRQVIIRLIEKAMA